MSVVTRWWWIRHAPVPDGKNIVYGQMDLDADCSDTDDFQGLARQLPSGAVLVTSDLKRTTQTADAIRAAGLDLPEAVVEPDLREQHFGDWQGMSHEAFSALREAAPHRHWRLPAFIQAPNGENFVHLIARVTPAIARLSEQYAGRDIVAVTHGGTIRAALSLALALDPETSLAFSTQNLGITRLDLITDRADGVAWRISAVNQPPR
jgi:alpha-ribazole phosphatase